MFSRVGEGNSAEPGPGPSNSDALAPISSPGPDGTEDRHRTGKNCGQMAAEKSISKIELKQKKASGSMLQVYRVVLR